MKELEITISDLPPMPRNRSHMLTSSKGRPMNIKTELCRQFEKTLEGMLYRYSKDFQEFKQGFDPKLHYIQATYYIFTPKILLYTKEDKISSRSVDTDAHKVMRDVLYKCLGIDDKVERDSRFFTPVSQDDAWNYVIRLKLEEKWKLETLGNTSTLMQSITTLETNDLL